MKLYGKGERREVQYHIQSVVSYLENIKRKNNYANDGKKNGEKNHN